MIRIALVALLVLLPLTADAFTCNAAGCTFSAKYTEPTTNIAGGPVNLTGTTVYYKVNGGAEKAVQVPASGVNGGLAISQNIAETILPGQKAVITGQVTAKNAAGESARTTLVTLTIDRSGEVAPNPPVAGSFE